MAQNRTSKMMSKRFKACSRTNSGGYIARNIKINDNKTTSDNPFKSQMKIESAVRAEVQNGIKKLVEKRTTIEEIKQFLSKEEYKKFEPYFETWIENWVVNADLKMKSILRTSISKGLSEEEIRIKIQESNPDVYELYEQHINNKIKTEIESKQREEKRAQEKINKQEEER